MIESIDSLGLIQNFDVEKINNGAIKILTQIGMSVPDEILKKKILKTGNFDTKENRIIFREKSIENAIEELRNKTSPKPKTDKIKIFPTIWVSYFFDPESKKILPYTTPALTDYTKLVDSLTEDGVDPAIPGHPQDVHPELQFLTSYYIMCCHSRSHYPPSMNQEFWVFDILREMAKVMGDKISIGVEPISPLTFTGNSIYLALKYCGKFDEVSDEIGIDVMPIMGITAPLDWTAGWAQSVAENLGSYIIFKSLGIKKIYPTFRLFPASMQTGIITFGAPEAILGTMTRAKIHKYYNIHSLWTESMLTSSKEPNQQAAVEKTFHSIFAVLSGKTLLEGGGMLGIDEIFSPQQLIIDLEIKKYIEKFFMGIEKSEEDVLSLVSEGLKETSFLTTSKTAGGFRKFCWLPKIFDYTSVNQWRSQGENILENAWRMAQNKIKSHTYELEKTKRKELDKIMQKAKEKIKK